MKINPKILSIPPYISTAWKNVISLHIETKEGLSILVIGLVSGASIEIPDLEKSVLQATFAAHEKFLEQDATTPALPKESGPLIPGGFPNDGAILSLPFNIGLDANMGNLLQHNSDAADSPDLPEDVIHKISQLSNGIGFEGGDHFPKPEPHCNCMHCQIMRAMQDKNEEDEKNEPQHDELVSEEDLRFREWDIQQSNDNLFVVTNPFNKEEHYNVFLGNPVGCTCGKPDCEHIKTVLNS